LDRGKIRDISAEIRYQIKIYQNPQSIRPSKTVKIVYHDEAKNCKTTCRSQQKIAKCVVEHQNPVGASSWLVARKSNITHSTVIQILKIKNRCHPQKRIKILKYTLTQLEKIPCFCRFLLRKHFCDQKVMDDEKYFTFSHSTLTEMNGFWTDYAKNTPNAIKYKAVGKAVV
jgi:hypothetical protein